MANQPASQQQLNEIAREIVDKKICSELKEQAIQLVFGDGNPDAEIVFIGEAPGKKEDESGVPFVGASGKFLQEMLQLIHLDRKDIYITNIVKYRPPNNRDPLPEEKSAFWPYLVRQLDVIKPKLVVTLGRHSMEYFLPGRKISDVHGESSLLQGLSLQKEMENPVILKEISLLFARMNLVILPLYHPAAALYSGGMRQTLKDDFSKIPDILRKFGI
jgi:uracil-DNA glycosylase family 4